MQAVPRTPGTSLSYRTRFAPSVTGPLHLGSLVSALVCWLRARAAGGSWHLRLEDLDEERCDPRWGYDIMQSLQGHGLEWDGPALWQSHAAERHLQALQQLEGTGALRPCWCSRAQLRERGRCLGKCRASAEDPRPPALRLARDTEEISLSDGLSGEVNIRLPEDFAVRRRDGVISYHLASVVDDIDLGVTEVVRGGDLLQDCGPQVQLRRMLGAAPVAHAHHCLLLDAQGRKLSKQNRSPPVEWGRASGNLQLALRLLRQPIPDLEALAGLPPRAILEKALQHWEPSATPRRAHTDAEMRESPYQS